MSTTWYLLGKHPTNAMCIGGYLVHELYQIEKYGNEWPVEEIAKALNLHDRNVRNGADEKENLELAQYINDNIGAPYRLVSEDSVGEDYPDYTLIKSRWIAGASAEEDVGSPLSDHLFGYRPEARGMGLYW